MTLRKRFESMLERNPGWSDMDCLRYSINENDGRWSIRKVFNECVNTDDYASDEKEQILNDLYSLGKK